MPIKLLPSYISGTRYLIPFNLFVVLHKIFTSRIPKLFGVMWVSLLEAFEHYLRVRIGLASNPARQPKLEGYWNIILIRRTV